LRTPLNSIIGFTGITLQEMSGPLNEEQKDNLSRVKRSANHLLALITDVIDISKIESGRVDSFPQAFSLNELVREAVDTIRSQVEDKGMSLEVPVSADVAMFTDRRRLLQCLINLLSNAVKYSEAGKITVAIRPLGEQVEIAVRDSGIGIAEADLPKLFEPFERVKSHLQVKAGGTGLGLYLTKKLVTEVLHGEVDVRSIQGEGSTFTIRIPPQVEEGREA
jgi:signal transduction histidine kinase